MEAGFQRVVGDAGCRLDKRGGFGRYDPARAEPPSRCGGRSNDAGRHRGGSALHCVRASHAHSERMPTTIDKDHPEARAVPATVHGDSGVTAVVAETKNTEAEDIEESEAEDVARIEDETGEKA